MSRILVLIGLLVALPACSPPSELASGPQEFSDLDAAPEQAYQLRCAGCHGQEQGKAPSLATLASKSPASVAFALINGSMRGQVRGLDTKQVYALVEWIAGEQIAYQPAPQAWCGDRELRLEPVYVDRWGFDAGKTAAAGAHTTDIRAENVADLALQWVFALPGVSEARSQPVIVGNTLFVAAVSGELFALDRASGCIRWHTSTVAPLRTALTFGRLGKDGEGLPVLFFGDAESHTCAVDARTGKLLWRRDMAVEEYSIQTGAIVLHGNELFVPVSLIEVALAQDPDFECCKAHGAVHRLDARSGEIRWTANMTPAATARGKTKAGTQSWGPSGAPVWSTPTVDARRGLVYVGTGQNASAPGTALSDAIVALDIETGDVAWHFQATAGDTYNSACSAFPRGYNCPKWQGPDFDFGASVILASDSRGRELLLAGQKSGDVYALDPDREGAVIWRTRVGSGSALGGVHWGMAVSGGRVFAAVNDPPFKGLSPEPGLYALDVDTGARVWEYRVERDCEIGTKSYFQRRELYPDCSFYYAFSAAVTVANDVVFAAALDGKVRAFAVATGDVLWTYDSARAYSTATGGPAHGGSIDSAGVQFAGDMAFVQSGYGLFGQLPGNALLAFRLPSTGAFEHNEPASSPSSRPSGP